MIALGPPRLRKPPPGARVDRTHPLARSLVAFWALNEAAGPTLFDATGRLPLTARNGPSWTSGPSGAAVQLVGNNPGPGYGNTLPATLLPPWPITLAVGVRFLGAAPAANDHLIGTNYPGGAPYWSWDGYWAPSTGGLSFAYNTGSTTFYQITSGHVPPSNVDLVVAFEFGTTGLKLYVNGALAYASAQTMGTAPLYGAAPPFQLGAPPGGTNAENHLAYWGGWWNRVLTGQEHAALAANPWPLFGPMYAAP